MKQLMQKLLTIRVRPYYIHQMDLVKGTGHFRTPVEQGLKIMAGLRGHTSGMANPYYVIDLPEGKGRFLYCPMMSEQKMANSSCETIWEKWLSIRTQNRKSSVEGRKDMVSSVHESTHPFRPSTHDLQFFRRKRHNFIDRFCIEKYHHQSVNSQSDSGRRRHILQFHKKFGRHRIGSFFIARR